MSLDLEDPIMATRSWTVTEARAKLNELIARARTNGPQTITRRGRAAAVIASPEEWQRKARRRGNLAEFFAASPLRGSGLLVERAKDHLRD
jgi:prevent-host-death family protein